MSTAVMPQRIAETSPRFKARLVGVFYLLNILTAGFAEGFVGNKLVADGNAAAAANNILAHQSLFQLGFAASLTTTACYVVVTALFYGLFKPVSRSLSLLAALFNLMGCAIEAFAILLAHAPLVILPVMATA